MKENKEALRCFNGGHTKQAEKLFVDKGEGRFKIVYSDGKEVWDYNFGKMTVDSVLKTIYWNL